MSNLVHVSGYVDNIRKWENDDGSVKLAFTVSSKTNDPKRYKDENNTRDFFDVNLYIYAARKNVVNHIVKGKLIALGGIPYQSIGEKDGKRYFNIKAVLDMVSFPPTPDNNGNGNGNSNSNQEQTQSQNQSQDQGNSNQQQKGSW